MVPLPTQGANMVVLPGLLRNNCAACGLYCTNSEPGRQSACKSEMSRLLYHECGNILEIITLEAVSITVIPWLTKDLPTMRMIGARGHEGSKVATS